VSGPTLYSAQVCQKKILATNSSCRCIVYVMTADWDITRVVGSGKGRDEKLVSNAIV